MEIKTEIENIIHDKKGVVPYSMIFSEIQRQNLYTGRSYSVVRRILREWIDYYSHKDMYAKVDTLVKISTLIISSMLDTCINKETEIFRNNEELT